MKKLLCYLLLAGSTAGLFSGCSSDDKDDATPDGGKKAKITITVQGADKDDDFISFQVVGGNPTETVWKVNGTERPNEQGIGFGVDDFVGNTQTYVVETLKQVDLITTGYQVINYGEPLTFTYKVEIDGKVLKDETYTLSNDGDNKDADYTY